MNKARHKKRISQIAQAVLLTVLLVALAWAVWYLWFVERRPTPQKITVPEITQTPKEYCTPNGGGCLAAPADWINYSVDDPSFIDLGPIDESVHIHYSPELSTKTAACPPNNCLLTVLSLENFGPPDTVLVKAVSQRPAYTSYQPQEFLLSAAQAQSYGLKAGSTSDLGVEAEPTFNRTFNGERRTQLLEVLVREPDNYASPEEAKKWFDTPEAKVVHKVITSFKPN